LSFIGINLSERISRESVVSLGFSISFFKWDGGLPENEPQRVLSLVSLITPSRRRVVESTYALTIQTATSSEAQCPPGAHRGCGASPCRPRHQAQSSGPMDRSGGCVHGNSN